MTQPTSTDHDRYGDVWRPGMGFEPGSTQPLPVDPTEEPPPGRAYTPPGGPSRVRVRRVGRRFRSMLLEIVLAVVVSAGVAAGMGWQVLSDLRRVIPGSGPDPYLELWSLAWSGHVLKPGSGVSATQLFDGNAFFPADYSLAFSDSLLGFGPFTWFLDGPTGLVATYNLLFVLAPALASLGVYALARQLGAHPIGAAVAGAGFAYAPWHYGQFDHLHVLSVGPLAIALAMLARGHGFTMSGRRTPSRPFWVLAGWVVAAWQLTLGFAVGLAFAYLMGVIGVLILLITPIRAMAERRRRWSEQQYDPYADPYPDQVDLSAPLTPSAGVAVITPHAPRRSGRLALADVLGGGLFVAVGLLMAYPYWRVAKIDPNAVEAARGLDQVREYSPTPSGLVSPPALKGTWSWLTDSQTLVTGTNEVHWLPGAVLLTLAVLGLLLSTWRWWWRLTLLVAALLIAGFSLGTQFPEQFPGSDSPFVLLWRHAPGWAADRAPGRLMIFATLLVALLAAGAVSRLCGWGQLGHRGRPARLWTATVALLPILVVAEGWADIPVTPVSATPTAFTRAVGPMVVLPSIETNDSKVMFWSAGREFPEVGNGYSGITPTTLLRLREELTGFPDARSVNFLRQNGFRSVVVLRTALGTDLWQDADREPDPALGLTRWDLGESVLFGLDPGVASALAPSATVDPQASGDVQPTPTATDEVGPTTEPTPATESGATTEPAPTAEPSSQG